MKTLEEPPAVPETPARSSDEGFAGVSLRAWNRIGWAALALLAYVPPFFSAPGKVAADTKSYLYLDPGRLLARAPYMWEEQVGLGTVTHQNIGYVFPMGPYYWLVEKLGVPMWVGQRIWLGSLLFFAGAGVLYLCRTIRLTGPGAVAAAVLFMLSPYLLDYSARMSALLLPWAGLGWMIGLVMRGVRTGGWRHAAAFALVIQVIGSVNATALLYAGLAPALWLFWAAFVTKEVSWRRSLATAAKFGGFTVLASAWWIAGLSLQGGYGINVLKYTETVEAVARTSIAPEVLRGLGYWFFYGGDKLGPWIEPGVTYTQRLSLIAVGYVLAGLGLLAAGAVKWKWRSYFVTLLFLGVAIAVGVYPYDHPSPLGEVFKAASAKSTVGLAMRSTGRATPLVVLSLAMLTGAGIAALARLPRLALGTLERFRIRRPVLLAAAAVIVLAVVNLPPLWDGTFYGKNLQRPEEIPQYWKEAIAALDAQPHDTRILALPGSDFASYRWGNTVDPITPGLTDRPFVARELVPYGSPPSADVLNAYDRRIQQGVWEPSAVAPVSRYLAVGDILLRNDLQTDRFGIARAEVVHDFFTPTPAGLSGPRNFGTTIPGQLKFPRVDETLLALPPTGPIPPLQVYSVEGAQPIIRAFPTREPVLMAGDGEGLVDLAAAGIVDGTQLVIASASLDPTGIRAELGSDAAIVVTDTNRLRARRWGTVRDNTGYTEQAGEKPLVDDPSDARLDVYPDATVAAYSVADLRGEITSVQASHYGNPISYTPEDRAYQAVDGDPVTAWRVAAFDDARGERIKIELKNPVRADHVDLTQVLVGPRNRWITKATLLFDGRDARPITLEPGSRTSDGQRVDIGDRTFKTLEIRIDDTNAGNRRDWKGVSAVGFGEIRIPGVPPAVEYVEMPRDLFAAAGADAIAHPTYLVMTRLRTAPVPPPRRDEENRLLRTVELPVAREYALSGSVRVSAFAPDDVVDAVLGIPGPEAGGIRVVSSEHLSGDVSARGSSAFDGDPATAWITPFQKPEDNWVEVTTARPVTFDRLDLNAVVDARHSRPTRLRIEAGGEARDVDVPANGPVTFAPLTDTTVRITITAIEPKTTIDYFTEAPITLPVAIADFGVPGVQRAPAPAAMDEQCRTGLLNVNGADVAVRVVGPTAAAAAQDVLSLEECAGPVALPAGRTDVVAADGASTGLDLDRLVFGSAAGGGPLPAATGPNGEPTTTPLPTVRAPSATVVEDGPVRKRVRVEVSDASEWLVLGQSFNRGWTARVVGHQELGAPELVNGYANGWRLQGLGTGTVDVVIEWTPQDRVWIAFWISGLTAILALGVIIVSLARRRALGGPTGATVGFVDLLGREGAAPGWGATVLSAVVVGAGAALVVTPVVGIISAFATVVAVRWRRSRIAFVLGAPAVLMMAASYIIVQQYRHRYRPAFEWPTFFSRVHVLGWIALVLVIIEVIASWMWRRAARNGRGDPSSTNGA